MKAVILAGGLGTRLSEETNLKPKPMIEIGHRPILWHIMKSYSAHGVNDFIICCGYKGYLIKEYFANYFLHTSDVTFSLKENDMVIHRTESEPWTISLIDTGEKTMTGGRLKRVASYLNDSDDFCFTYGDGVSNVNISNLIESHRESNKLATLTATRPPGRYGALKISSENLITEFQEKPDGDGAWINGGFFVLNPKVISRIEGDSTSWESEPLSGLALDGELNAYMHDGFWHPMDTLRDKTYLNNLWEEGQAPWKTW